MPKKQTPKTGQTVRVILEGTVLAAAHDSFEIGENVLNIIYTASEHVKSIEVLPDPLKVGTVLEQNSPEPPIGTVLKTANGNTEVVLRASTGYWYFAGAGGPTSWSLINKREWVVLHVGEGK